jgi:uncharacterized protein involved in exopolysaccharide biosynthesis
MNPGGTGRLLRLALLPVAAAALAAAVAAVLAAREAPRYRATATVVVAPSSQLRDESDKMRALETLERRSILATFARVPPTREVREEVAAALSLPAGELDRYEIGAVVLPHAHVLAISVEGPDAGRCAAIAAVAVQATHHRIRALYPVFTLRELEAARPPGAPFRPDVGRDATVAGLLGLFVGALAVAAWSARAGERAPNREG